MGFGSCWRASHPLDGIVREAGHAVRVWSDDGAVVILVEAPRLSATRRGISTPDRIMWQSWPGEPRLEKPKREQFNRFAAACDGSVVPMMDRVN